MPSVVTDTSFLTSSEGAARLRSIRFRDIIADARSTATTAPTYKPSEPGTCDETA